MLRAEVELLLHRLFRRAVAPAGGELPDGVLLERFAHSRDEGAFAALVGRHGPMVFVVCRRVLGHHQDAEDAFQATFLILARRAAALDRRGSVAAWLHTVAHRLALRARADAARRPTADPRSLDMRSAKPDASAAWRDVRPVLDEELGRLPEKYRAPVVLCCLEGHTQAEAARRLGCPEGTLSGRLARARAILRDRLGRRGVTLSAGLLATVLADGARAGPVPAALARLTIQNAVAFAAASTAAGVSAKVAALAEGGLQAMFAAKVKLGVLVLAVILSVGGAGVWARQALSERAEPEQPSANVQRAKTEEQKPPVRVDLHGDPLPNGAITRLGTTRWRHEGEARWVSFSGDGRVLAALCSMHMISLWDTATGRLLHRFQAMTTEERTAFGGWPSMDLSPDGKTVAVREFDGTVRLWNSSTGKLVLRTPTYDPSLVGGIGSLCFSPDGKMMLSAGSSYSRLLDVATGKQIQAWEGLANNPAFSPDGKRVALASKTVQVWDTITGKLVSTVEGVAPSRYSRSVAFSPDGRTLACGEKGRIILSEVATGKTTGKLEAAMDFVPRLAFTPDGKSLVSLDGDSFLRIWDMTLRKERSVFGNGTLNRSLALSPDGRTVAVGTALNVIRRWDVATGKELFEEHKGHDATARSVVFSPDGKVLYSGGEDQLIAWDVASGKQLRPAIVTNASVLALSPDGKLLANTWRYDKSVWLWNATSGDALFTLPSEEPRADLRATGVAFTPDGKWVVAVRAEWRADSPGHGDLHVWESTTGQLLRATKLSVRPTAVAVAPDGRTVAVGNVTGTVSLRDPETGAEIRTLQGNKSFVTAVAFSPDGRTLAGAGDGNQFVLVWEVATGKEVARLEWDRRYVMSVAFSPDGRVLAGATGHRRDLPPEPEAVPSRIHFWDIATGKEIMHFEVPSYTLSVNYAPDGRTLASGHNDGTVLVWDLAGKLRIPSLREKELDARELEDLWAALVGADAGKAQQALWTLAAMPEKSVPLLKARLKPAAAADPKQVARQLADLDSPTFATRQAATQELEQLGDQVLSTLNQALADGPPLEKRQRLESIRTTIESGPTGEALRGVRAIQALEKIGTLGARELLKTLAAGAPAARQTRDAKAALQRLATPPTSTP